MCLSGSRFCLCISKMPYSLPEHCFLLQCSKSCEGGFRVREVRCLSDDMTTSTHCDPQLKPEEKEPCNTQDCIPEIGKVEELCVLTMELHLVEKEVVEFFFLKYRVLFLHKLWLFFCGWKKVFVFISDWKFFLLWST